jgi:hypothetical protein
MIFNLLKKKAIYFLALMPALILVTGLLSLTIPNRAFAESDGMGAVDYNDKAESLSRKGGVPRVGRKVAQKYMGQADKSTESREPASQGSGESHYLAIHIGTFLGDDAYKWGSDHESNVGKFDMGVTYRIGEWLNSADFAFRADFESFNLSSGGANKLSLMPVIIFPDAASHFPLYFGGGVGPGFYLKQISGQSAIALDYQLFLGARFFNLFENTGLFVEAGVKNHFHILSNGQYNGSFIAIGALFTF